MNKIPAGYRLSFYSCDIRENNPHIIIKEGLTQEQAQLLTSIGNIIQDDTYLALRQSTPEWRINKIHEKLYAVLEQHQSLFHPVKMNTFKEDVGAIMDYISENITGYSYDEYVDMRVFNGYKAEYIPDDIVIQDVTKQFKQ
jgi:hypothetical protein